MQHTVEPPLKDPLRKGQPPNKGHTSLTPLPSHIIKEACHYKKNELVARIGCYGLSEFLTLIDLETCSSLTTLEMPHLSEFRDSKGTRPIAVQ